VPMSARRDKLVRRTHLALSKVKSARLHAADKLANGNARAELKAARQELEALLNTPSPTNGQARERFEYLRARILFLEEQVCHG
jgi:hypothetical protein